MGLAPPLIKPCPSSSGTTATLALLKDDMLLVAGVGDSK